MAKKSDDRQKEIEREAIMGLFGGILHAAKKPGPDGVAPEDPRSANGRSKDHREALSRMIKETLDKQPRR